MVNVELSLPTEFYHSPAQQIAETIGGDITPERVVNVINKANEQKLIFHGVSDPNKLPQIIETGISPLTPESGMVSCWTSGNSLFIGELSGKGRINTYDTSFFHYGQSLMAITCADYISDINFDPNNQHFTHQNVQPEDLNIIYIDLDRDESLPPRENGQKKEQLLFRTIEQIVDSKFTPGKILLRGNQTEDFSFFDDTTHALPSLTM